MKQKVMYGLSLVLCIMLFCSNIPVRAAESKVNGNMHMEELKQFRPVVESSYSFTFENAFDVGISNREITDTGVVYMEYEVGEVLQDNTYQSRIVNGSNPSLNQIGGVGQAILQYVNYERASGSPLLVPGATYFICFAQKDDKFEYYVQRTLNGKVEQIKFPEYVGTYEKSYDYFTVFFGEGGHHYTISAEFKNFRCYDGNGKDLGVQFDFENRLTEIKQYGLISDSSLFEAGYYCEEKPELGVYVFEDNFKGFSVIDGVKSEFIYSAYGNGGEPDTVYITTADGKKGWDCSYMIMKDEDGNTFKRLQNVKVTFVVGDETTVQELTPRDGWRIEEPEEPKKAGHKFLGWYLGNDEKYEFDSVIDESITLYARWENDAPNFITVQQLRVKNNVLPIVVGIGGFVLIIAGAIVCNVWIRRKKHHVEK